MTTARLAARAEDARVIRGLHRDIARIRDRDSMVAGVAHVAAIAACITAWGYGLWPVSVLLWLVVAWSNHAALARLHEAVHHMLSRSRWRNELFGAVIGTLAWTPISVYRYVHAQHHAHLGRPADPEFRPYSLRGSPRWVRRSYLWGELLLGVVVTPALYCWRTAIAWRRHRPRVRRRLVFEGLVLVAVWTAVVGVIARFGWWEEFVVGHVVPAWLAGVMQTVRKFTEHLGMRGDSIPAMTRTVVYRGRLGRMLSWSQLHVDHHGTHHHWPRIPWFDLPRATPIAYAGVTPPFRTHAAAIGDALRHMGDPTVGPQWAEAITT